MSIVRSRERTRIETEFAFEVAEQYQEMMLSLEDEELVQLATWEMEGFSNDEIAKKVGRATRTVERKLQLIRKIWIHRHVDLGGD